MTLEVFIVRGLVLGAEFVNGWTDAPNATAAAVATKLLSRTQALFVAASMNALGLIPALIFGSQVAHTIGTGIIAASALNLHTIGAAMCAVILWGFIAAGAGLPVSKSHALFASLAGVALASPHAGAFLMSGWTKVGYGVVISILVASTFSWILGRYVLGRNLNTRMSELVWRRLQLVTVILVSAMHGWNDGLKFVGVFALVTQLANPGSTFTVTPEIILLCSVVMGAGTLCGGWKIVARIGKEMVNGEYEPWQGVVAELIAATCIGVSAFGGVPMSTTHTVVSSMAGAKASKSAASVNWPSVGFIAWGWISTIVFCGLVSYFFALVV